MSIKNAGKTTALIVGAGAVENAWAPILRAIQPYHDFTLTADGANSFFARLIYLLRWYSADASAIGKIELNKQIHFLRNIRSSIASELNESKLKGEIRARDSLKPVINKMILPFGNRFIFITTNWDDIISEAIEEIMNKEFVLQLNPLHIHGCIKNPNTLYLPSEVTKEPYRSNTEEVSIGTIHGTIWRSLEKAHRVILYGLSIDPLDAELGQTLACGWDNSLLEEILIVNPRHEEIAHRVNLLLSRKRDISIKGINPISMEVENDYTIWRYKQ